MRGLPVSTSRRERERERDETYRALQTTHTLHSPFAYLSVCGTSESRGEEERKKEGKKERSGETVAGAGVVSAVCSRECLTETDRQTVCRLP